MYIISYLFGCSVYTWFHNTVSVWVGFGIFWHLNFPCATQHTYRHTPGETREREKNSELYVCIYSCTYAFAFSFTPIFTTKTTTQAAATAATVTATNSMVFVLFINLALALAQNLNHRSNKAFKLRKEKRKKERVFALAESFCSLDSGNSAENDGKSEWKELNTKSPSMFT